MLRCPNCGQCLQLTLQVVDDESRITSVLERPAEPRHTEYITFTFQGKSYSLSSDDIYSAAKRVMPGTDQKFSTTLPDAEDHNRKYPAKQVVREAMTAKYPGIFLGTGSEFTTNVAVRILRRLGFIVFEKSS